MGNNINNGMRLPIKGFVGHYEIDEHGNVYSLARADSKGQPRNARVLKQATTQNGYRFVQLCKGGKARAFYIHALVANLFIGPKPSAKHQVNHKDGAKHHNHYKNLEWATRSENLLHARDTLHKSRGGSHHNAVLTDAQVKWALNNRGKLPNAEIQRLLGVGKPTLDYVFSKKGWRHLK